MARSRVISSAEGSNRHHPTATSNSCDAETAQRQRMDFQQGKSPRGMETDSKAGYFAPIISCVLCPPFGSIYSAVGDNRMHCSKVPGFVLTICFAVLGVSLSGCVEQSMVIKVKADGSGVIQLRNHEQKVVISFGSSTARQDSPEKSLPPAERLEQITKQLGSGVKLVSARESTNRSGWPGYDLVWEFTDINQVTLSDRFDKLLRDKATKDQRENAHAEGKSDEDPAAETPKGFRFAMREGLLEVKPFGFDEQAAGEEKIEPIGTVDPFAAEPVGSPGKVDIFGSLGEEIAIKLLSEARIGLFVEVDGEIESTNARHREGNLITLVKINVGQLLENPESRERLKRMGQADREASLADLQALAEQTEGLDLDLQHPLKIKIR